jgi:DNA transposition AAA+ family ATPase
MNATAPSQGQAPAPTGKIVSISSVSVEDVRGRVQDLMRVQDISQSTVAKETSLSSSVISQFLNATYQGNNDAVATKLTAWLNSRSARDEIEAVMPKAPDWIEAPTAKRIYAALEYAQMAGDIACIYGGAGLSKSTTIRRYKSRNNNVWVVTATPATASTAVVLSEIAEALGLRDYPLHPARLQRAIIRQIAETNGLIVVDEAQHLTKQALEMVRSLHDASGVGLAMLGNASLYNALFKGGNNGFAQLFSRVGKRVALTKPTIGDVHAIAGGFGVKGGAERKLLETIAFRPGALRMVVKTLRLASVLAAGKGVTRDHIEAAFQDLQGEAPATEASS